MPGLETTNFWLSVGTILLQVVGAAFLILYFVRRNFPDLDEVAMSIQKWGLCLGFLFSLFGVLGALYYSEVLSLAPCGWCWVQRIFLFPQPVLFLAALWKKDRSPFFFIFI